MVTTGNSKEISQLIKAVRKEGKSVGFVPTMGYLHKGHASLIERSKAENDYSVVSVFVNPSQFNDPKDLELYPRDFKADSVLLDNLEADLVFAPEVHEIYPENFQSYVTVEELSRLHEGEFRPGHFRGVTTVVNVLLAIVKPDKVYFGEKDFQQLAIIRQMVRDLRLDINVTGCPIVREADGLALSSRNVRLAEGVRVKAPAIYRSLQALKENFIAGETSTDQLVSNALNELKDPDFKVEYLRIIDSETLAMKQKASKGDRVIIAVHLGGIRLIDNIGL